MPTPSLTHAHEPKPTQAQRAGCGYMVGHVRLETVETTSPVPKTQPFCPWGGYTSDPEHHIHTIQPVSITRALHAFKWNRHDRQICVITVTRSKLHMHAPSATIKRVSSIQLTHWSGLSFTSRSTLIWRKQRQQNVSIKDVAAVGARGVGVGTARKHASTLARKHTACTVRVNASATHAQHT